MGQESSKQRFAWTRIKDLLIPPRMEGTEKKYITTVLYTILAIALLSTGSALIASLIRGHVRTAVIVFGAFAASVTMLGLTYRGHLSLPRILFPLSAFVMTTFLVLGDKGIHDEAVAGYPLTLVLAGLLLGRGGVILYALLGLAALVGLTLAEVNGFLVTPYTGNTSYTTIVYSGVPFGFTACLLYITIDNLTSSLQLARRNAKELAESNAALETMQASLEDQVVERTASAEAARQEAEAARQVAEAQAWQTAGLVQLGDAMRGEQDLPSLSNQVLRHLCHYLDARVGALFVTRDEALHLTGTYACTPEMVQVDLGQGLVGQAVRDGQPIVVHDVPASYMPIVSGLGDSPPRQVAIWPLLYEGQALGAIELGLLEELSTASKQFLERAAERVAMSLHTAQSRARINALLTETQAQASELALREEELQAINEELQAQAESLQVIESAQER